MALSPGACRAPTGGEPNLERAEFGVLFGGDVQDRSVIPLELDARRQELALRLSFRAPLARDARVEWEVEKPTAERGADGGVLYAAELGQGRARAGERRFESGFAFRRGDRPGSWLVRVRVDGQLVHERRFDVVSAKPERSD